MNPLRGKERDINSIVIRYFVEGAY